MNRLLPHIHNHHLPIPLSLESSQFYTGTQQLLSDASRALLVLAPLAAAACWAYMGIRKMNAEDQEAIMWKKRMVGVGVGLIIAVGASAIVALVTHYYSS